MTVAEEVCVEGVGRAERVICRGCGAVDIEYDRSGVGHAIAGSPPDQCGPVETFEEDALCGHPESEHRTEMFVGRVIEHVWCFTCHHVSYHEEHRITRDAAPHAYRTPGVAS